MTSSVKRPLWFTAVAAILVIWGLTGCFSCVEQLRFGADAMGPASAYDRALYASLPGWYNPCYVVAVLSGTAGAVALLVRGRIAIPLAIVAFVTVLIMFGYMFIGTDLIAHKGVAMSVTFPVVIAVIALFQWWLARNALARGWIG